MRAKHTPTVAGTVVLWVGCLGMGYLAPAAALAQVRVPVLPRADFNRLAAMDHRPLFWRQDDDGDGVIDPSEVVVLGLTHGRAPYVRNGTFTPRFIQAYRALVDRRRREAVGRELEAGRPTLVHTELKGLPSPERQMVRHLMAAAELVDQLHLRQMGSARFVRQLRGLDQASRSLFARNAGPWCTAPRTRNDGFCSALPDFPPRRSENYPQDRPQTKAMCTALERNVLAAQWLAPFAVLRVRGKTLVAVPYSKAYAAQMRAVAGKLQAAARALRGVQHEGALRAYLEAAAGAFRTNDWAEADKAWVAMNAGNSRWYLRVAPDEAYRDPCQRKAMFHLVLALVDRRSLAWKRRLTALRGDMERAIAKLIGPPYTARKVAFEMPDFIRVVYNAGDSRHPLGATMGQSLPNWGTIAKQGRARTVVVTNLYADPDSRRAARGKAHELLDQDALGYYVDSSEPSVVFDVLREASHNFGPGDDHEVRGKRPDEVFGASLAAVVEQIKAQGMALWYLQMLQAHELIRRKRARQVYVKAILRAMDHLARGVQPAGHGARPYGQVAAVLLGVLQDLEVLRFHGGRFSLDFTTMPAVVKRLASRMGQIKAQGKLPAARKLVARYTTMEGLARLHIDRIRDVMRRYPNASFQYAIEF